MQTPSAATLALCLIVTSSGCAAGGASSAGRSQDLISEGELREYPEYTALQIIRQFRPTWLNDRRGGVNPLGMQDIANPRGIRLYVNGVLQHDGLEQLELLEGSQLREMRKLDASEATQRFGLGHTAGAILVWTRRR